MAPTRRPSDGLLARVNFPLYSIEMLTSRHCVVAGGGGTAKTGIANGFEIYEIYHNGKHFVAEEVVRHETGTNVVMNCAVTTDGHRSYLVAGQESHCQLYQVNSRIVEEEEMKSSEELNGGTAAANNLRNRRNSTKPSGVENIRRSSHVPAATVAAASGDAEQIVRKIRFDIKTSDLVQTDFTEKDPLQRVVRISPNGKLMATGGTDGYIRVWSFPRMKLLHELPIHTKEADDVDFSPDSKRLVSIAKDGQAVVTGTDSGKELVKLQWTVPEGSKYLFKRCRFSVYEGKAGKCRLFTIANPIGKAGKLKGYLQQWDSDAGQLIGMAGVDESLSSLAVRDDGRFVAVGTMFSGSVSIYIAYSLQRVLHIPNAHSMFVTGLDFLPINRNGPSISSDSEVSVLSISVDNKVCIHSLYPRNTIPTWLAVFIIFVAIFLTFVACSLIDI